MRVDKIDKLLFLNIIIILFFTAKTEYVSAQNYKLKSFQETLPQSYIYSISQSDDGFLWIGTEDGLVKYDGINFTQKFNKNYDNKNFINTSYYDNGTIWFGHFQGTITKLSKDSLISIYNPEKKSTITEISKAYDGKIWASTLSNGFIIYDPVLNSIKTKKYNEVSIIKSFTFIDNSRLLVGSQEGLWLFTKNRYDEWIPKHKIKNIEKIDIAKVIKLSDSNLVLIASQSRGLYTIDTDLETLEANLVNTKPMEITGQIQDAIEDNQNNIWISTFGSGVIKLSKSINNIHLNNYNIEEINLPNSNKNMKSVFEDREGNIWFGGYGSGIVQLSKQPFSYFQVDDLENGGNFFSVACDNDSVMWAGTVGKIIKFKEEEPPKTINLPSKLSNSTVSSLYINNDSIWLGTEKDGLYIMDIKTEKINQYYISNGILENSITTITGRDTTVWIATKKGICKLSTNSKSQKWYTIEKGGLPHNLINHIYLDTKNRLWISTPNNTIAYIDEEDKITKLTIHSDNKIFTIGPITEDTDSTIWIGTQGAGVFKMQEDSIANLTKEEGLFSNYCNAITSDKTGNIWVTHSGGISRIKTLNFTVNPIHKLANIKSNYNFNKNAIYNSKNNRIIMGSNFGLWIYNPKSDLPDSITPILTINSIKIGNKEYSVDDKISIKPGKYDIEINYIGLFLENAESVWYKYELSDIDLQPNYTQKTSVTYKNVKSGKYNFRIKSSLNGNFEEASYQEIKITIKKPFWQSPLFIIIFSSFVLTVTLQIIIKREQKHKKEKYNLKSELIHGKEEIDEKNILLDEKQQLIVKQNEELRNYKEYLEKIVNERTQELIIAKNKAEESDRLKTAFLNNISHEIRTPLHAICGFSKFLDDDSFETEEKQVFVSTINQNAEDLLQMVDEIIDMSVIDSQTSLLTDEPFNLNELFYEIEENFTSKNKDNLEIKYIKNKNSKYDIELLFDRGRFKHIFYHLINNSLKFTEKGSVTFGYKVEEKHIVCFVRDTGIGITPSELKEIFKPFHKATSHTDKLYRGAGIGLTIVKKLIDLMQGTIWVESEIQKGTSIYLKIPLIPLIDVDIYE